MSPKSNGDANNKRHNFINLTLQVGKAGEGKYAKSGKPFASVRAFYSQGKDKNSDEFLPSIWFAVKAFGKDGEEIDTNPAVSAVANATKGDKIEVKGRLGLEEWTNNDGEKQSSLVIFATEVKPAENGGAAAEEEPQP
jgi:single-stranded DNA-binding protein